MIRDFSMFSWEIGIGPQSLQVSEFSKINEEKHIDIVLVHA